MKELLGVAAIVALMVTAGYSFAGGQRSEYVGSGGSQGQLDSLKSSRAEQDERIDENFASIQTNAKVIEGMKTGVHNPWYVRGIGRMIWSGTIDIYDQHNYDAGKGQTDTGYGFGVALGRQFGQFRIDGELASQKGDIKYADSGDLRIDTAMANATYEIPVHKGLSIFSTAGIGAAKIDVSIEQVDDSETTIAYKAGLGLAYVFNKEMALDIGYEYMRTCDVELGNGQFRFDDIKNSSVTTAIRYTF